VGGTKGGKHRKGRLGSSCKREGGAKISSTNTQRGGKRGRVKAEKATGSASAHTTTGGRKKKEEREDGQGGGERKGKDKTRLSKGQGEKKPGGIPTLDRPDKMQGRQKEKSGGGKTKGKDEEGESKTRTRREHQLKGWTEGSRRFKETKRSTNGGESKNARTTRGAHGKRVTLLLGR